MMQTDDPFWSEVLEPGEVLVWTGRPRPRLHPRNWRLGLPFAVALAGAVSAVQLWAQPFDAMLRSFGLAAIGAISIAALILGGRQLRLLSRTRYALTDRRALYFELGAQTAMRSLPRARFCAPKLVVTAPPGVMFGAAEGNTPQIGFEYLFTSARLKALLDPLTSEQEPHP